MAEHPYGILPGPVDEVFHLQSLTALHIANIFVANYIVGMLCYGQRREPLEQAER